MRRAIVIGSGWGAHAARALARRADVDLVAVVGRGSPRSRALAEELGVDARTDDDVEVDLAVVAVGERVHATLVAPLLTRGVHVLVGHPVCSRAEDVAGLDQIATESKSLIRTDYTFRLRPELAALRPTSDRGELLRVSIEAPGRWLPIAIDVAVELAGPVGFVHASRAYPTALVGRAAKAPHVFVPTVMLTHEGGAVTSIVPVPHAPPAEPVRVCASYERGRVVAVLPRGGARWLALGTGGRVERSVLVEASAEDTEASVHARGMAEVVRRFVDGLESGAPELATLAQETHLRRVWTAIWGAAARGERQKLEA